ncbi:MAG TPA: hypothetical protein VFW62_09235 [bacterium]|nr:hypothetical protein [bacterium]
MLIMYTPANIYRCGEMRLIPGMNDVPERVWNEVKDHPLVKMRVEKGLISLRPQQKAKLAGDGESTGQDDNGDGLTSLGEFSAKEAEALVKETFDLPTLERWQGEETRKGVLKAIEAQIDSLKIEDEENEGDK